MSRNTERAIALVIVSTVTLSVAFYHRNRVSKLRSQIVKRAVERLDVILVEQDASVNYITSVALVSESLFIDNAVKNSKHEQDISKLKKILNSIKAV